jgi:hypothetical protein
MKLIVIFRNVAPLVMMEEPVSHRMTEIELTDDQIKKLKPRYTHSVGGKDFHESISYMFVDKK